MSAPTADFEPADPQAFAAAAQPGPAPDPIVGHGPTTDGSPPEEPKSEEPKAEKDDDVLEVIMPSAEPREQKLVTVEGEVFRTYTQKPLSFFRKMQFFKLLAKALKKAIDEGGPDALTELFGGTGASDVMGTLTSADFADASGFLRFVMTLVEQAEDILEEAYVIWLAVPPGEREMAKAAMRGDIPQVQPLSDEDGVTILKTFIVQNWGAMQAFFRVHAREVFEVARQEQRRLAQDDS